MEFIGNILEWFMVVVMSIATLIAVSIPILATISWFKKTFYYAEKIPDSVVFEWMDENGYLRWTLTKSDGTSIDLNYKSEELMDLRKKGAIWISGKPDPQKSVQQSNSARRNPNE